MRDTIPKPPVHRITGYQILLALLISAVLTVLGTVPSYSFMAGSLIHIAGSAYFAHQAFKMQGARRTAKIVHYMYQGETGKIILSAAMFAVTFVLIKPLDAAFVFTGYIVQTIAHLVLAHAMTQKRNLKQP
jgi:ATP synthase protein I